MHTICHDLENSHIRDEHLAYSNVQLLHHNQRVAHNRNIHDTEIVINAKFYSYIIESVCWENLNGLVLANGNILKRKVRKVNETIKAT